MRNSLCSTAAWGFVAFLVAFPASATLEHFLRDGGTLSVSSVPVMSGGQLTGCQLSFDAIVRDFAYRQGDIIRVSGSTGLMVTGGTLGATVKIVVLSPDPTDRTLVPSAPSRAYLVGNSFRNNFSSLVTAAVSDQPGGWFAVYQASPALQIVADALNSGKLVFAFNQFGKDTDIQVSVDLMVEQTDASWRQIHSEKTIKEYGECVLALTDELPN